MHCVLLNLTRWSASWKSSLRPAWFWWKLSLLNWCIKWTTYKIEWKQVLPQVRAYLWYAVQSRQPGRHMKWWVKRKQSQENCLFETIPRIMNMFMEFGPTSSVTWCDVSAAIPSPSTFLGCTREADRELTMPAFSFDVYGTDPWMLLKFYQRVCQLDRLRPISQFLAFCNPFGYFLFLKKGHIKFGLFNKFLHRFFFI